MRRNKWIKWGKIDQRQNGKQQWLKAGNDSEDKREEIKQKLSGEVHIFLHSMACLQN